MKKYFYILSILSYALIHYLGGLFGQYLNGLSNTQVFFWPPAGLALALLIFLGYRFWPGIFLGGFFAALSAGSPIVAAVIAGAGSISGPLVAAYVLKHFRSFNSKLASVHDVTSLAFLAAPVGSVFVATIIATSLVLAHHVPQSAYFFVWMRLWISDVLSSVIVATFVLVWLSSPRIKIKGIKRGFETLALFFSVAALGILMFTDLMGNPGPRSYLIFFPVIWAALRFGPRESATIVFAFCLLAVWSTMHGFGPFIVGNLVANLAYLQSFLIITSVISMILAAAVNERKDLSKRKDNFIGIASHELKTPLTSIKIIAQLLKKNFKKGKKEIEYLNIMDEQIDKLTGLVKSLLNLSKIQAGKLTLHKEFVWLEDVISENAQTIMLTETSHKIVMEGKILKQVYVDKDSIGQIIMNLLTNAIKHSPNAKKVVVTLSEKDVFAQVAVRDFGHGIPNEKLNKIFELYYQSPQGENDGGLGLGLFISAEIIKKHQGRFWVKSQEGKGSTFYFTLPFGKVL